MSDRLSFVSASAERTQEVGARIGEALRPGDVLVLTGDLGAGKTQLTKGIARALGVTGEVTSPTFALEAVHEGGRIPLYHFDLYRLHDADELGDAGLWDVLGGDGVCVIEWGEQFSDEIGPERVDVYITREEGGLAEKCRTDVPAAEEVALDGDVLGCEGHARAAEPARRIELVSHDARGDELVAAVRAAVARCKSV